MKSIFLAVIAVSGAMAQSQVAANTELVKAMPGFKPAVVQGVSASAMSVGCTPIEQYGGGVSVSDNSTALNTALANLSGTGGCIYFGSGKYVFTNQVSYTYPGPSVFGVRIVGSGQDATILNWSSGNGLVLNVSNLGDSFGIEDLSFTTTTAGNNTYGFIANGPASLNQPIPAAISSFKNVSFRGDDCYSCNYYWGTAIYINGWSNVNLVNSSATGKAPGANGYSSAGVGLRLNSTATPPGVQYNVFGGNFNFYLYGIEYGGYSQGLTVNQTNFVGNTYGIYTPSGSHVVQLNVSNSQFSSSTAGIADVSGILYTQLINNQFIEPPGSTGVYLNVNAGFNIVGNTFAFSGVGSNSSTSGIVIGQHIGSAGVITGNLFSSLNYGVLLGSTSANTNVQSNAYAGNTTNVANNGTNNVIAGGSP